jgi:Lrp/AsnC family transcriptional regulator, regulator for asnA, asnC and gidA
MNKTLQIDKLDRKILSMILKDARVPFLEIARECNVSGAAIHQRMQKLIKIGIIAGSEYIVDLHKLGYDTRAYIGIFLEKASMYEEVVAELERIPEIVECHYTTGNYSIFIKIVAQNNEHLKSILVDRLQSIKGISRTETFISLEERFKRQLPIDQL